MAVVPAGEDELSGGQPARPAGREQGQGLSFVHTLRFSSSLLALFLSRSDGVFLSARGREAVWGLWTVDCGLWDCGLWRISGGKLAEGEEGPRGLWNGGVGSDGGGGAGGAGDGGEGGGDAAGARQAAGPAQGPLSTHARASFRALSLSLCCFRNGSLCATPTLSRSVLCSLRSLLRPALPFHAPCPFARQCPALECGACTQRVVRGCSAAPTPCVSRLLASLSIQTVQAQ
eukprot:81826-Rhodomonas_salina.2